MQDLKDRLLERPRTANTGAVIGSASTESDVLAFIDVLVQVREGVDRGKSWKLWGSIRNVNHVNRVRHVGLWQDAAHCWVSEYRVIHTFAHT